MPLNLAELNLKSAEEILVDLIAGYRNSLIKRGIANPNVSFGTAQYGKFQAFANEGAAISSNIAILGEQMMPDSATGSYLERIAALYLLGLRAAGPSSGPILLETDQPSGVLVAVPSGAQLIDSAGLTYEVAAGGSFELDDEVSIISTATGSATNLEEGTILTWTAPPAHVAPTCVVGAGGLTGGNNSETIEQLRQRVLTRLRNPPGSANAAHVNLVAEDSSSAVDASFTYPCANGPGTLMVAVTRAPTSTDKTRDVDSLILSTKVAPAVVGLLPEYAETTVTTVTNEETDISIGLSLPAATQAAPPGPGGGWVHVPFPVRASHGYVVPTVTSTTVLTVDSDSAPTAGSTQVCYVRQANWKLYTATVSSFVDNGSNSYTITLDTPFVDVTSSDFIFPNAERMQDYLDAFFAYFATLGPGQKTSAAGLLPRALRRPLTNFAYPSDVGPSLLRFMSNVGEEVLDADFLYRSKTTPTIPTLINSAPNVLIPRHIGIYPL